MDSRSKILTLEAVLALPPARPLTIVTGTFDLLRAPHVRALRDVRRDTSAAALLAVVLPADCVLNRRARAEMAAALRVIDYVLSPDDQDLDRISAALQPAAVVRLEDSDAARLRELVAHVHSRQHP